MSTQAEINWLVQELQQSDDSAAMLHLFKQLLTGGGDSKSISSAEYDEEVKAASKRVHSGRFTTQEDFEREMEKW